MVWHDWFDLFIPNLLNGYVVSECSALKGPRG
jgi:hypothetical protein